MNNIKEYIDKWFPQPPTFFRSGEHDKIIASATKDLNELTTKMMAGQREVDSAYTKEKVDEIKKEIREVIAKYGNQGSGLMQITVYNDLLEIIKKL